MLMLSAASADAIARQSANVPCTAYHPTSATGVHLVAAHRRVANGLTDRIDALILSGQVQTPREG